MGVARVHQAKAKALRESARRKSFLKRFLRVEWLIVFAALISDVNSFGHRFVFDDHPYIVENPFVQNPGNALRFFASTLVPTQLSIGHLYRPVTALSLSMNSWLHGLNPDGFHIVNRLLHLAICLVVYWVLRFLFSNPAALFTALLFAVHPIQTEAVTYVTGRSDLLAMLFGCCAWYCYVRARQSPGEERKFFAGTLAFYFLSMLSKENGIAWIVILLLTEFAHFSGGVLARLRERLKRGLWKFYAASLIPILAFLALRALALQKVVTNEPFYVDNPLYGAAFTVRILTALKVMFQSVGTLLWPVHLSADYSYNQIPLISNPGSSAALCIMTGSLALVALLAWSYCKERTVFLGLGFFFAAYLPTSNLLVPIGSIRADRFLYMPSIGIFLILGMLLAKTDARSIPNFKTVFRIAFAAALSLLFWMTVQRNSKWEDEWTLAIQTVRDSPDSSKAHQMLGLSYFGRGEYILAAEEYRIAESIYADDPTLLRNSGKTLQKLGRTDEAILRFRRAVELAPLYPMLRYDLASALRQKGDFANARLQDEAIIDFYDDLIREHPTNADHHYYKANALTMQGRFDQALSEYRRALDLDPDFSQAKVQIERILAMPQGQDGHFRQALEER